MLCNSQPRAQSWWWCLLFTKIGWKYIHPWFLTTGSEVHNANIHGGLWFPLTKCHCIIIFKVFAHYFAQSWQGAVISINPAIKSNYESGRKWWRLMGRGGKWDRSRAVNWSSRNFTVPGKGPYQGLLLVESAYKCYHNKIYLRLRILAPCLQAIGM